jgi:hypothetical protein
VERTATRSSPIVAGGGLRCVMATREHTTIPVAGVVHHLTLSPGLGLNPYLHVGCRVAPRVTALAYWDGMRLGRSSEIVLRGGGPTQTIVFQPATDMDVIGVRVAYGF